MRTFFRNKLSDLAARADLMVIQGRELADSPGNRGVTKSKDNASEGLYTLGKALRERLRRLQGPCGPGPSIKLSSTLQTRDECQIAFHDKTETYSTRHQYKVD